MSDHRPPRDDLVRATRQGLELRDARDDGSIGTLSGHFSVFGVWYEVNSVWEGHFIERVVPGAFKKTFAENRSAMKVTFNHGQDPSLGDKVLGPIETLEEDERGAHYEVPLFDTSYNRDLLPGLKAGVYGASFRFSVTDEEFNKTPTENDERKSYNPALLPERTIKQVRVSEFGPVTYPASDQADAAVRSMTDAYAIALLTRETPAPPDVAEEPPHDEPEAAPEAEPTPEPPDPEQENSVSTEYETREDKAARLTELKAELKRAAEAYPGVMPDDVQARWDADNKEHDDLERDIRAWDDRQTRLRKIVAEGGDEPPIPTPTVIRKVDDIYDMNEIRKRARSVDEVATLTKENALRSIDSHRLPKGTDLSGVADIVENRDSGEEGEGEVARRILLTGSPAYKRAYSKLLLGQKDLWSPEEARAAALAVVGTTTTGGFAVPYVFDPTILNIGVYTAQNPYRSACRVETISNGNNWRTVTVGAVTSLYVAESAAATEQGPTFGQPTYTVQRAHAFATVSMETLQDRPDIAGELGSVFAESKATYEENQFTLGTGAGVFPQGMFRTTAYTATTTATNDVTALLDFTVTETALPLRHRANGNWFMNRSTIRQLMILDTTYRYFSGSGLQFPGQTGPVRTDSGNTGLALLGYPVWEVPSAVSTLTTDGAIIAVLCDPRSYIIVDRIGMNVEVIPNMLDGATPSFPTGQRGIYMYWRNTAKPINADAGRQVTVQ